MKNDIAKKEDIIRLVDTFYSKVREDDLLGSIFNTMIADRWTEHLEKMHLFWGSVLLDDPGYTGNTVKRHVDVDKKMPFGKEHMDRWQALWGETIDRMFEGEKAELAKHRAMLMGHLIGIKVEMGREGKLIM